MNSVLRLRWSNGHSFAREFRATRDEMEAAMTGALIDYRLARPHDRRIELHVWDGCGWRDPAGIPIARDEWSGPVTLDNSVVTTGRETTYCHVISIPDRRADRFGARLRGTDWVLIVGPDRWWGEILWDACSASAEYVGCVSGSVGQIIDRAKGEGTGA